MPNRSVRAALVFFNDFLFQLSNAFITLVITPLIVANLGTEVYGAWRIINKITPFLTLGNFKPLGLLRLILAKNISNDDFVYKQQQIGASITILILSLPIVLILSFLLFYFRDTFIPVSTEIKCEVDSALLILIFFMIILPFLSTPITVVLGLNMQYKLFGLQTIAAITSALLQYLVVVEGYSLPSIAIVSWLPTVIISIISYIIIIKNVPWFKFVWPADNLIRSFFQSNLWALLTEIFRYIFNLADIVLVGFYFGTTVTAVYSLTKALVMFLFMPVNSLVESVLAGIGDLVGRKELKSLKQLRSEQINVTVFVGFVIGIIVMFFNASFVGLWVDEKHFGGEILSRWLIAACIIDVLVKIEANYLDAALKLKGQTLALGSASVVYLVFIALCEPILGLIVFPVAQVISQTILIALYWIGLRDCLQDKFSNIAVPVFRPLAIAAILVSSILWIKPPVIQNWTDLFIHSFAAAAFASLLGWFLILKKNDRNKLILRLSHATGNFRFK